jgi:serine/threonine protein phosphatase PrpC
VMASATELMVSNCGDSRAVLCRNRCAIDLSRDHKPFQPDEKARIEGHGYVKERRRRERGNGERVSY